MARSSNQAGSSGKSLDTELMMQWCNATYRTVSRDSSVERIWQTAIPREAMHHAFLRHGLLALAALDRARSAGQGRSRDEHLKIAQMHQTQAMTGLTSARKAGRGQSQSTSNAIFAVSCTTILYTLAYPLFKRPIGSNLTTLDDLCDVFEQSRQTIAIMMEFIDDVKHGDLNPLIQKDDSRPKMPDTSRLAILSLRRLNGVLAAGRSHHETDVYETTMQHLSTALERLAGGGEPSIIAIRWIHSIPSRFIELVHRQQPFALVILAHFAVVLHSLRGQWWMGNWGMDVLEVIGQSLDMEWRPHISWVVDATGWHIPVS